MPHECYVAAKVPSPRLKQALEARAGTFTDEKAANAVDSDGNYIGEHHGATYVFDGEMILAMGASPDLFTNLSGELSTTVVACGYETVSGTYMFLAAESGKLLRYLSTSTASRKPLTMGAPLSTEARTPLHTVEGIHAALTSLGFDVAGWHESGTKVSVNYPEDFKKWEGEDGPLGLRQAHAAHEKEHGIPFEQWTQQFQPQVVLTNSNDPSASFALRDGSAGFKLEMQKNPADIQKKPWHQRLRGWFGG